MHPAPTWQNGYERNVIRKANLRVHEATAEMHALNDRFQPKRHSFGTYRRLYNTSIQSHARATIADADRLLDRAALPLEEAIHCVDRYLHRLVRSGAPETHRCPLLVEYTTLQGTLAESRATVRGVEPYLPLVLRTREELPFDEFESHGRELHHHLRHLRRTARYFSAVSNGAAQLLDSRTPEHLKERLRGQRSFR